MPTKKVVLEMSHETPPFSALPCLLFPTTLPSCLFSYLPNSTWLIPSPAAIWDHLSVGLCTILSSLTSSVPSCCMYRLSLPSASASADALHLERRYSVTSSSPHSERRIHKPRVSILHNNSISPSPLRPHVIAKNRITHWKTPYSITSYHHLTSFFPPKTIHRWQDVLSASVEERTRENYGAGLLRFNQFCDKYNIHENLRMPASEALLCLFIANQGARTVSDHTITSWLMGLEMWHSINGATWHGGQILKRTKCGVAKLTPPSSRKPPRDPVSLDHMRALRAHLDLTNTRDCAIWAAACTAWRGITRYD
jgi:hypothetical protein